jgi:hypothetical protein
LDWAAAHASIGTTIVATCALITAIISIIVQKSVARRRAALDFFVKTDLDEKMLTAFDNFHKSIEVLNKAPDPISFCTSEETRKDYLCIRKYLNVHELVAVGIREAVLDPDVCYSYWGDTLTNNYRVAKPVLDFLATREKNKYTYSDLQELNARWVKRKNKATG